MNDLTNDAYIQRLDNCLTKLIQQANIPAKDIKDSMLYALFPGGKRLRPLLVYLTGSIINAPLESLDYIGAAIEMTHCYSLIHDDLPAMDNDDIRRGKPSVHKAFNEATAILTGDGLQAFAIEVLLTHLPPLIPIEKVAKLTNLLVKASGPSGMVSGQALDLSELSNPHISEEILCQIHLLKTGCLIEACILMALAAGEPSPLEEKALTQFAQHFGLLFQMQDDYLDAYHSEKLGKGRSSDLANEKQTYASLLSPEQLYKQIEQKYQLAYSALETLGAPSLPLVHLLNYLHQQIKN